VHELSVAHAIVSTVVEALPNDSVRVTSVTVTIGALSGVVPQALEFAYDVAAEGTSLSDAALVIERTPVVIDCELCGRQELPGATDFRCPVCAQPCGTVVSGKEMQITNVTYDQISVGAS